MRRERTIEVGGKSIAIGELTVAEILDWFKDTATLTQSDFLDGYYFDKHGVTLTDLTWITSAERDDINDLTPGDIDKLIGAVKGLNQDFFFLREKVLTRAMQMAQSEPSSRASSSSPDQDTQPSSNIPGDSILPL